MIKPFRLLPEWVPQEAVLLTWPDQKTDWQPWLHEVRNVYIEIINKLNQAKTPVILLVRENELDECKCRLDKNAKVLLITANFNDTWIRDYGFLTCSNASNMQPVEFVFNGWGQKFDASLDNQVNHKVLSQLCQQPIQSIDFVLEGGAIEIDQEGRLLSTQYCLTNPQRNGSKSIQSYQQNFEEYLGVSSSTILQHGHLEGDDTDGHIDTLVRFTPNNALVIQSAFNRPDDSHFKGLLALVEECKQAFPTHDIYELPLPNIFNTDNERLPASYANFLISNQHVLCPIYQQAEDEIALQVLKEAYPDFVIVPINCLPLIQQFGSLHCISMQIPCGVLKPQVLQLMADGVCRYDQ
jgi:agmatine/peptidylarginine deiminase